MGNEVRWPSDTSTKTIFEIDGQSAIDVGNRLEQIEEVVRESKSYEEHRINSNVLMYWESKANRLAFQAALALAIREINPSFAYRLFPMPSKEEPGS
jgi:hypothetical protein